MQAQPMLSVGLIILVGGGLLLAVIITVAVLMANGDKRDRE